MELRVGQKFRFNQINPKVYTVLEVGKNQNYHFVVFKCLHEVDEEAHRYSYYTIKKIFNLDFNKEFRKTMKISRGDLIF